MRLEKLTVRGLGPFREDAELDLTTIDSRIVAVTGANGEGKSTLLELFPGALFRSCPTRGSLASLATRRDALVEARVVNGQRFTIRQVVDAVSGKGETLIADAEGNALNASSKLKEADAWVAKHLLPPEVLYASTFAHQGSGGFLELKPADRKKVLLRILGIERLEAMAERARERARKAKEDLRILQARIDDERGRAKPLDEAEARLENLRAQAKESEQALEAARAELDAVRDAQRRAAEEARAYQEAAGKLRELTHRRDALAGRLDDLEKRAANNRRVLERAAEIRAAVERTAEIDRQLAELELEAANRHRAVAEAEARVNDLAARRREVAATIQREQTLLDEARGSAAQADDVRAAAAGLPEMEAALEAVREIIAAAERSVADLAGQRLAGAEERVSALRDGLHAVVGEARSLDDARGIAQAELDADDDAVAQAERLPVELARAEESLRLARESAAEAEREYRAAQRLADRLADVEDAARRVAAHAARVEALEADERRLLEETKHAHQLLELARGATGTSPGPLLDEKRELEELVKLAGPLAQAEARLAEIEPQIASISADVAEVAVELESLVVPDAPRPGPSDAEANAAVKRAEEASRRAVADIAIAERDVALAREVADRLGALETERAGVEAELADWARLAADLGKDGIQALEIDAAGPELTEIVNDLLRSCHGSRFTVAIETTKLSSDGKRQLEGCEVHVVDTVRGREGAAETFSGGERVIIGEAVSLALSVLACRRAGLERPTLVRDESGAALDADNGRAYLAMLRRAADIVDADKVLFVSHTPELQELADARIVIAGGRITIA